MSSERLVMDIDGILWLRIEDAGYLDDEGRVWLVGRVKWMVERKGKRFWSTDVEQKVMEIYMWSASVVMWRRRRKRKD